jgi:hypothetical protein
MGKTRVGVRAAAAVLITSFIVTTTVVATSAAAGTGSISGTVTNAQSSAGLAGVCISAFGDTAPYVFRTTTAGDGTYTISGLSNGQYAVEVDPTCNLRTASTLEILYLTATVASGSALTGVNAALVPGGNASGTVVGSQSNVGVAQTCVVFKSTTDPSNQIEFLVNADGSFTASNMSPGDYNFIIEPNCPGFSTSSIYAMQTWPQPVIIASGMTVNNLNVTLEVGATIMGTVISATTHAPVNGAGIVVMATSGVYKDDGVAYGFTASDGTYSITGLAPGSYLVEFDESVNVSTTSGGTTGPYAAEQLPSTVTAGATLSNQNFVLYVKNVSVPFTSRAYNLTNAQKRVVLTDARTIAARSLVVITGYALNNRALAKKRAEAVAAYMKLKEGLASNVKMITNMSINQVTIVNDGDSRNPAS